MRQRFLTCPQECRLSLNSFLRLTDKSRSSENRLCLVTHADRVRDQILPYLHGSKMGLEGGGEMLQSRAKRRLVFCDSVVFVLFLLPLGVSFPLALFAAFVLCYFNGGKAVPNEIVIHRFCYYYIFYISLIICLL